MYYHNNNNTTGMTPSERRGQAKAESVSEIRERESSLPKKKHRESKEKKSKGLGAGTRSERHTFLRFLEARVGAVVFAVHHEHLHAPVEWMGLIRRHLVQDASHHS